MAVLQKKIPLWEKWNEERLRLKEQEVTTREFNRGWRQKAISDEDMLFRPEHVEQCWDASRILYFPGDDLSEVMRNKNHYRFMGVDLAIADASSKRDYFVMSVISVNPKTFHRTLLSLYRRRGLTFNQQIEVAERWAEAFDPTWVYVENNAYQQAFIQEAKRVTSMPVKAFTTTAVRKADLEAGLPRLSVEFEQKKWTIPYAEGVTRDLTDHLSNELKSFPLGSYDDCVMSLWFARNAAADVANRVVKRVRVI